LANQRASAKAFFDGYKAWNIDAILAYRTPDCLHQVLPASLNRTAQTNADVTAYFKRIENTFANFTVRHLPLPMTRKRLTWSQPTVINEVHDTTQHFAIVHAKSTAMTKIGQYTNEYALTFRFTDDGKKVKHIEEFIDSKYTLDFNARLAAAP
jgi:ketosteroid isomerase-like protein